MDDLGATTMTLSGFEIVGFVDKYGKFCSLQVSGKAYYLREEKSSACVWLGIEDPTAMILASKAVEHGIQTDQDTGWVSYPLSADIQMTARMHLDRSHVKALVAHLQTWLDTGSIEPPKKNKKEL